jgi:hypothetical protein
MKKLGTIACAALAFLCTAKLSAAVESDIVGYTTITMEAGKWYQVGCPFDGLDGDETLSLVSVFNVGFTEGDKAYIYADDNGTYEQPFTWGVPKNGGDATWLNARKVASDFSLNPGQAVFIHKAQTNDVTFAGKVDAKNVVTFGSEERLTWSQIIFPYPVATDINDMKWAGLSNNDKLYVYNTSNGTYDQPYTWKDGKWYNARGKVASAVLPVNAAMFIQKTTSGVATLSVE